MDESRQSHQGGREQHHDELLLRSDSGFGVVWCGVHISGRQVSGEVDDGSKSGEREREKSLFRARKWNRAALSRKKKSPLKRIAHRYSKFAALFLGRCITKNIFLLSICSTNIEITSIISSFSTIGYCISILPTHIRVAAPLL
jgi:hypothetical protein